MIKSLVKKNGLNIREALKLTRVSTAPAASESLSRTELLQQIVALNPQIQRESVEELATTILDGKERISLEAFRQKM
jgi:hypothetical protein